jgi:hypothetical protein
MQALGRDDSKNSDGERRLLVAGGNRQVVDEGAASWRFVPDLEACDEVEDVRRGEAAACAVNREDGLAAYVVEVDVLHHGASPVREVEEIHARLVGVDRRFDRNAGHRFFAGEEQVEIAGAPACTFLDDLRDRDAELFPLVFLLEQRRA